MGILRRGAASGAVPRGLLGMIGLVLAFEAYLVRHRADYETSSAADWRQAARASRRLAPRAGLLCFGDSLVKLGVQPRVLEARLGRGVRNCAVAVGQAPTSYFLLRRALRAGARPEAVVVDFTEHLLSVGPRKNLRQWPELLDPAEAADLAWSARDAGLLATVAVGRGLPSYKDRHAIRRALVEALGGRTDRLVDRLSVRGYRRNWGLNGGAQVVQKIGHSTEGFEGWFRTLYDDPWRPDPLNLAYMRRFLDLATARGIRVFWLLPPLDPVIQAISARQGVDAAVDRLARAALVRHPNLVVVDGRRSGYETSVFFDPIHLDRDGTARLSEDLAVILRDHLRGPASPGARWEALPAFREGPSPVALEDLLQSCELTRGRRGRAVR